MIDLKLTTPVMGSTTPVQSPDPFLQNIANQIKLVIQSNETLPISGYQEKAAFEALKPGLLTYLNTLMEKSCIQISGLDAEHRPYFVCLQAIVEHVLSQALHKDIRNLIGFIHTPTPATPLCTQGAVSPTLVQADIAEDPARRLTVETRAVVVRSFLNQGAELYVLYPKEGLAKRTITEQTFYRAALNDYRTHLKDTPLSTPLDYLEKDRPALIGATYFFKNKEGQTYSFAIQIKQANAAQKEGEFGLWFGSVNQLEVRKRLEQVYELNRYSPHPLPFAI